MTTTNITGPWHWECDDSAVTAHAATREEALELFAIHLDETTDDYCVDESLLMYCDGKPGFQS